MHKRLVRALILIAIALAAALGVASAAGALDRAGEPVQTSTDANSWSAGSFSASLSA